MKKYLMALAMALIAVGAYAQDEQETTVVEPEFLNAYCILTADSKLETLPKENGMIGKHMNKAAKFSKIGGALSQAAGAAGIIGISTAGSSRGAINGLRTIGASIGAGGIADAAGTLAGAVGQDIIFKGGSSAYKILAGKDVQLVIKAENNETDPLELYRIVRFVSNKKERRIQWMEITPALIGSSESKKAGYVYFTAHKYGEQSYILTIPASELQPGEYGIFYMNIISGTEIPVGTFCAK